MGEIAKPRIAYLRERAGLTQLELSRFVGVTENTIQNWERGRAGTDHIEKLIKFCKALNCQLEDLIEYVDLPDIKPKPQPAVPSLAELRQQNDKQVQITSMDNPTKESGTGSHK